LFNEEIKKEVGVMGGFAEKKIKSLNRLDVSRDLFVLRDERE